MKPRISRRRGFSLVETMLAIGITATVLITLLALVPMSLNSIREASLKMADARIVQTVAGRYQLVDWDIIKAETKAADAWESALEGTGAKEFKFDENGIELPATFSSDPSEMEKYHAFTARAVVIPAHVLPGDLETNPSLRQVLIRITSRIDNPDAFSNPDKYRQHQTLIARIDR